VRSHQWRCGPLELANDSYQDPESQKTYYIILTHHRNGQYLLKILEKDKHSFGMSIPARILPELINSLHQILLEAAELKAKGK
jgi:hypothetical protein